MKRSVGLIVMVRIPQKEGSYRVMAALQRRGTFNHEKMAPESYPNCLQVTCHGKLNDDEDFQAALYREMCEELGVTFAETFKGGYPGHLLVDSTTDEKRVMTFGVLIPINVIRDHVRLGPDSGGLIYISQDDVGDIVDLSSDMSAKRMKENGPEFSYTRAMFPDEIKAVKKAFEIFGTT